MDGMAQRMCAKTKRHHHQSAKDSIMWVAWGFRCQDLSATQRHDENRQSSGSLLSDALPAKVEPFPMGKRKLQEKCSAEMNNKINLDVDMARS